LLLLSLMLQAATPPAPLGCFHDGPMEGLCADALIHKAGDIEIWSTKPGTGDGAPMSPDLTGVIARLIRAYDAHEAIFPPQLLTADPTSVFCADTAAASKGCLTPKPLVTWPFASGYEHNRPYLMKDGRVRLEWTEGGKLKYLSYITAEGNRVGNIRTVPASIAYKRPA